MTIEEHIRNNPEWDIYQNDSLDFVEPENSEEALKNLEWVFENGLGLQELAVVVRSYYDTTIEWSIY